MTAPGLLTKSSADEIPGAPGTYFVHLKLFERVELRVGRKGSFPFDPGHYFYCGSAMGPGGLKSRLNRHIMGSGSLHWHIDWLRRAAVVAGWGYRLGLPGAECEWSQKIAGLPGACITVPGFGASDCRSGCLAHLIHFSVGDEPKLENRVKLGDVNVWRIS
jgi:Uri superfamily endonuclease